MKSKTKVVLIAAAGAVLLAPLAGVAASRIIRAAALPTTATSSAAFNPWDVRRPLAHVSNAALFTSYGKRMRPPKLPHPRSAFLPNPRSPFLP